MHSILTSSQSHRWIKAEALVHDIHGVFKRPQLSAFEMTREVIARAPPPAFLFPNQQCQRPRAEAPRTASQRNHPFSARCRRRRLSIQPRIPCQTVFYKTVRTNPPETAETNSSRPRRPSSEERQSSQVRISRKLFLDLKDPDPNSCELFTKPSGAALSKES